MIACPSCGAGNVEGTRFCVKCGTTLPTAPGPESWRQSGDLGQQQPPQPQGAPSGGFAGSQPGGYAPPDPYAPSAQSSWQPQPPPQGMMQQPVYPSAGLYSIGEKRDPMMVVLFAFITCGIYILFWWYSVITEIKNALGREDINPGMEILLIFLTCGLYGLYLHYKYSQLMLEMQDRAGRPRNDISMMTLLLAIFGLAIVSIPIMQSELNQIWDAAAARR
jgi:Domain of unknown function (DUF4234)/zinc-ribbon domain